MQIEKNSFISFETFFAKSQKRCNKYRMNSHLFIVQVKKSKETDKLRFCIGEKIFGDLLPLNKITLK